MTAAIHTLPDPQAEPTIKAERVAAILSMSVRGVYAAAERGELPAIRVGRAVRFPTARLLAQLGLSTDGEPPDPEAA